MSPNQTPAETREAQNILRAVLQNQREAHKFHGHSCNHPGEGPCYPYHQVQQALRALDILQAALLAERQRREQAEQRASTFADAAFHFQTCRTCAEDGEESCHDGRLFAAFLCYFDEKCESGCDDPVTHHDVDGIPLCDKCWESLAARQEGGPR